MTEQELKHYLLKHFGKDFIVRSEVEGKFLVDDSKVIIDYLMFPSPYLVTTGAREVLDKDMRTIHREGVQVTHRWRLACLPRSLS